MKALVLASLLALAAPQAAAGDGGFRIGFSVQHKGVRVNVGVGKHAPPPRYEHRRHHRRVWVPGRYKIVQSKVWVPAYTHKVWRPAEYGYLWDRCGHRVRYVVHPAHWQTVRVAGHWDYRSHKVWRPGHYEVRQRARHRRGHRV
ncbi:MAG: hypothetical protein ACYTDU_00015 [Planctomycetota bacterium]|jgi:hypothetical protein